MSEERTPPAPDAGVGRRAAPLGPLLEPRRRREPVAWFGTNILPRSALCGTRFRDEKVRAAIRAAAPEAIEKITFGMPGFYLDGHPIAYYAAFKQHCSYFAASRETLKAFARELERYNVAKGTIRYPIGKPLPASLIKKLARARIAENESHFRR